MDIIPVITIEGAYSGDYYCPADQIQYIDKDTFMNVSSDDIILYATDSIEYILLRPFQEPLIYNGTDLSALSDFGSIQFNNISSLYHAIPIAIPIFIYMILTLAVIKLFKH